MEKKFVTYLRVSTAKQGASGLGIDAQRKMCQDFIIRNNGMQLCEFVDVESGTHRDRKGLWSAIDYCKKNGCGLVIAKLDRLARDVEFTFRVINTGIEIHFTDMPQVNTMILGVFASVAQYERELVSTRTKAALDAKKERGEKLGGSTDKWQESYKNKTAEQKQLEHNKHGKTKNERFLVSRDVQVLLKVLRNVFPSECVGEPNEWAWNNINTHKENRAKMLRLMSDYKEMDTTMQLFADWDFANHDERLRMKLVSAIKSIKRALSTQDKRLV